LIWEILGLFAPSKFHEIYEWEVVFVRFLEVKTIAREKQCEKSFSIFHSSFFMEACPIIETKLSWDKKNLEIDLLASIPSQKLFLVGSCKRNVSQMDYARLVDGWNALRNHDMHGIFERLKVTNIEDFEVRFLHFEALGIEEEFQAVRASLPNSTYLFSLIDLLSDFS
jgi:hypothetical protein